MDVVFRRGRATATEVRDGLPDAPSYSAVRALLRILEDKGHVRHETDGARYVYAAVVGRQKARRSALRHLVETFFDGSAADAAVALLDPASAKLSRTDLDRLGQLIDKARKEQS